MEEPFPTADPFRTKVTVRVYELDSNGHLNQAVYLQYAEHARWKHAAAAGVTREKLLASGAGPVYLENTIRFRRELQAGDDVDISCQFLWGDGRTFQVQQQLTRGDGVLAAEVLGVAGVMDMTTRKLIDDPAGHFRKLASDPAVLGL